MFGYIIVIYIIKNKMDTNSMASQSIRSNDKLRKSVINSRAKDIIKSPYNKVDIKGINLQPKIKKKSIEGFPPQKEIETFLKQLTSKKLSKLNKLINGTVDKNTLKKAMNQVFHPPPDEKLTDLLFQRFRPLKFKDEGREIDENGNEMVVLDLLIALALLSRVISKYNDKLRIIFNF